MVSKSLKKLKGRGKKVGSVGIPEHNYNFVWPYGQAPTWHLGHYHICVGDGHKIPRYGSLSRGGRQK